jgi:NAD(P)-dependent dehydrogenase (short-subunit alcohol dehydrogenase family)
MRGAAYTSSKHALVGLTKNPSAFYSHTGIKCNAILPVMMLTDISSGSNKTPAKKFNAVGAEILFNTIEAVHPGVCEVDDVANLALLLYSDASRVVDGACISADKGWAAAM